MKLPMYKNCGNAGLLFNVTHY